MLEIEESSFSLAVYDKFPGADLISWFGEGSAKIVSISNSRPAPGMASEFLTVKRNQKSPQKQPLTSLRKIIGPLLPSLKKNIRRLLPNLKKSIKKQYLVSVRDAQIKELKSNNAHLQHLLFGRSTEKKSKPKQGDQKQQNQSNNTTRQPSNRKRGHQPGKPGHGRRKHENLPVEDVKLDLPENKQYCATCQLPFKLHPGTDDCDVIEIVVKPHIRRYHRKRYRKTCSCPTTPTFISPSPPARLVNKGLLGTSVWVDIIINKYCFRIPINRQLQSYKTHGLDLSAGTIITGMKTIPPMIKPVVELFKERVCSSNLKHADETRWGV